MNIMHNVSIPNPVTHARDYTMGWTARIRFPPDFATSSTLAGTKASGA